MSYGTAFPLRITPQFRIAVACLAASLLALAGCERSAALSPAPRAIQAAPDAGLGDERRRDDPARDRVWVLNSQGVFMYRAGTPGFVEITLPSWQWLDAPYGSLPDLALGPDGEAVITSNVVPILWRIDPETLAVSMHELALDSDQDKDVGFSSLVYSAEHEAFFAVSDAQGSRWQIDRFLKNGRKLPLRSTSNPFNYRVYADTRCSQGVSPKFCTRKEMQS